MVHYESYIHEIGDLLNKITLLASVADSSDEYLAELREQIQHACRLHVAFREYRKSHGARYSRGVVNIKTLINELVKENTTYAAQHNVKFIVDAQRARVWTDTYVLRQCVQDLITNAVKYSGEGRVVYVGAICVDDCVVISIADQGIGMTQQELAHLGEPFYRAHAVECEGTGMGWAILKEHAARLNWTVNVTSEKNKGTCVTVALTNYAKG